MNRDLRFWFEYESGNGENARKVLQEDEVAAKIDSHLVPIVKFMESHMVFNDGGPKSGIMKCNCII